RDQINVLQNLTVRHRHVAGDCRCREWARDLEVCIRPRYERIVSRNQHALGFELQIQSRFRELEKRDSASHSEGATGQIACESIQTQRVLCEDQARIKIPERGKS